MICFFHSADMDGHLSGALVKIKYPDCKMAPIDYGEPFPFQIVSDGETAYMVDFSLPMEDMETIASKSNLIWIDHHKTAIEAFFQKYDGHVAPFDSYLYGNHAACWGTWEVLYRGQPAPKFVEYISRYDTHDYENLPVVLAFQLGVKSHITDPSEDGPTIWEALLNGGISINDIVAEGWTIIKYLSLENVKQLKRFGFETSLDGHKAVAINSSSATSAFFDDSPEAMNMPLRIVFARTPQASWRVTLYSTELDCSEIAKKHGGGGHKGAAGFVTTSLPFAH